MSTSNIDYIVHIGRRIKEERGLEIDQIGAIIESRVEMSRFGIS